MGKLAVFVGLGLMLACEVDPIADQPAVSGGTKASGGSSGGARASGGASPGGISSGGKASIADGGAPSGAATSTGGKQPGSGGQIAIPEAGSANGGEGSSGAAGNSSGGVAGSAAGGSAGDSGGGQSGSAGQGGEGGVAQPNCALATIGGPELAALGPHNHVFLAPAVQTEVVKNYADQVIFAQPSLRLYANFNIAPGSNSQLSPSDGAALDPWLGEVTLIPPGCAAESLVDKTLRVTLLWRLNGAIGQVPAHGVYLGGDENGTPTLYQDASVTYNAASASTRSLNSLAPIQLSHTFADDAGARIAAGGGVFLRVFALSVEGEIPTTVYVGAIEWL